MKAMIWLCLPALLAAAPAGAQVVSGSVVDDRGAPLANASVMVAGRNGKVVAVTSADQSGRYTLHLPAGGLYRLYVMGEEHVVSSTLIRVEEGETYASNVRLRINEPAEILPEQRIGRPVGVDGRPLGRTTPGGSPGGPPPPVGKVH